MLLLLPGPGPAAQGPCLLEVQLIAGDGLSALALQVNGPALIKALQTAFAAKGFKVGKPLFVKFARIGVQDEIGVITQAKSTVIVVGERPGLGTGDSLSIYTAFGPSSARTTPRRTASRTFAPSAFPPSARPIKKRVITTASLVNGKHFTRLADRSTTRAALREWPPTEDDREEAEGEQRGHRGDHQCQAQPLRDLKP